MVKCIIYYIKGTLHHSFQLQPTSLKSIFAYSDVAWAGSPDTRHLSTCFCNFFGTNVVSWVAKKQHTISRSSKKSEYQALIAIVTEVYWSHFLLHDLRLPFHLLAEIFCDNLCATYITANPIQHAPTKHIEVNLHFINKWVTWGDIQVKFIPSKNQIADIFTKGLNSSKFLYFKSNLMWLWTLHKLQRDNRIIYLT